MISSRSVNLRFLKNSLASAIVISVTCFIFLSPIVIDNTSGFNLAPLHFGHGVVLIYASYDSRIISELVSL